MTTPTTNIPHGICHCGCGNSSGFYSYGDKRYGIKRGDPKKYAHGHNTVLPRATVDAVVIDGVGYINIPISLTEFAIVDAENQSLVSPHRWHMTRRCKSKGYAATNYKCDGIVNTLLMHRMIMGVTDPKVFIDHSNGNTLDNRLSNLRIATNHQNGANRTLNKNNKSGYKGMHWNKNRNKWHGEIRVNGKLIFLGYFDDPKIAHEAYCEAAKKHFGEFWRPE